MRWTGRWLTTLAVALAAAACDEAPAPADEAGVERSEAEPSGGEQAPGSSVELEAKAPEAEPPLPQPPAMSTLMDAAAQGSTLPREAAEALRRAQLAAGDVPVIVDVDGWTERAEVVLAFTDGLREHGLSPDVLPEGLVDEVAALKEELFASEGWTGERDDDGRLAAKLVDADRAVMRLWMALADAFGAIRPHPPRSRVDPRARLAAALPAWVAPDELVATLTPPHAQYEALREALREYRELERAGGFVQVPEDVVEARPGRKHPGIKALRARLAQEGTEVTLGSDAWDDELTEALKDARELRQLTVWWRERKLLDKALVRELSRPVSERIANLELNLARWRGSELTDHPYAVFINLPDYHGEVWDGTERLLRFKTVVGSNRRKFGEIPNKTPLLSANLQMIIYNPYWNVPERIFRGELMKKAEKTLEEAAEARLKAAEEGVPPREDEPLTTATTPIEVLEEKGYEIMNPDRPDRTWIRMPPGRDNALGKVKFLFENRWFVFLHDTNQKRKFKKARRAFSHGCMRVEKPLELAELLLRRDGSWELAERKKVLRHRRKVPIELQHPVPVVIDYITARVDAEGRVRFLHDLYRYDREQLANR